MLGYIGQVHEVLVEGVSKRSAEHLYGRNTQNAVVIEGDPVVTVRQGAVDPATKKEGANSYHINPVVDTLTKHANRLKKLAAMQGGKFDGIALVMVDKRTPYRLLTEVLYSAGQAELRQTTSVSDMGEQTRLGDPHFALVPPRLPPEGVRTCETVRNVEGP